MEKSYKDYRKFIAFLIKNFNELQDFISLINGGDVFNFIKNILNEKIDDLILEKYKLLKDEEFLKIYLYLESLSKEDRVFVFQNLLTEIFQNENKNINDIYSNIDLIKKAYDIYKKNFIFQTNKKDILKEILNSSITINSNKFKVFTDNGVLKLKNQIVIGGRYGTGKTLLAQNLIIDLILSNNNGELVIIYFGTGEVDESDLTKRIMQMRSTENINEILRKNEMIKLKKQEIENNLKVIDYDIQSAILYIIKNLPVNKLETLFNERLEIYNKIMFLEDKKYNIETNENIINKEIQINKINGEINSLNLKKQENMFSFLGVLENYNFIYEFSKKLFFKIIELKKYENIEYIDFKLLNEIQKKASEITDEDISLTIDITKKITNFLENINLEDDNIKSILIELYNSLIEDVDKEIKEIENLIQNEYNKTDNFLKQQTINIYSSSKLKLDFIEETVKSASMLYPNKKIIFIIDYQQVIDGLGTENVWERGKIIGEKILELCNKYNAFCVLLTQLNDFLKAGGTNAKNYNYRPKQSEIRDGESICYPVSSVGMIVARDMFMETDDDLSNVDKNFVIYEIFLTKNRKGPSGLHTTQYFILDKKKMNYIPVNPKYKSILDERKDIFYLDQLKNVIKEKNPQLTYEQIEQTLVLLE